MINIKDLFNLVRVDQWQKNLLIFCPIFFINSYNYSTLVDLFFVFVLFIFGSSLVYIFNDYIDQKKDKLNPFKKDRPLASNKISINLASKIFVIILFLLIYLSYQFITKDVIFLLSIYLLINISYSLFLKKIYLIDIIFVSSGYVIRVLAGYSQLKENNELFLLTGIFFLSLIILIIKRKSEFSTKIYKKSLKLYNHEISNKIFYTLNVFVLINYYLFSKTFLNTGDIVISFIPVIISLFRLVNLLIAKRIIKNISFVLFSDKIILINFTIWILIIYFRPFQNFL